MKDLKDGKDRNGISCFLKELLTFIGFINKKEPTVDDTLLITSSVRDNVADEELFWS